MSNCQIVLGNLSHISYDHHVLLFTYKDNWRGRPELQMGSQPGELKTLPSCALSKHQFIDVNTLALSGQG